MRHRILLVTALLALMLAIEGVSGPIEARQITDQNQPIIYWNNGDLYRYNIPTGTVDRLTTWGYNDPPVISPDGNWFAYDSTARQVVNAIGDPAQLIAGDPPSNTWLWNLRDPNDETAAFRIADQPPNMVPPGTSGPGTGIIRSRPSWSPDSTRLAWTESILPSNTINLVVYNRLTQSAITLVSGLAPGFQDGGFVVPPPTYGSGGIIYTRVEANNGNFGTVIQVFDPSTGAQVYSNQIFEPFSAIVWLEDMADTFALIHQDGFTTINVRTSSVVRVTEGAAIGALSRSNPQNTSAGLRATFVPANFNWNWTGRTTTNQFVTSTVALVTRGIAVSPSGDSWAWMDTFNRLNVVINGTPVAIPATQGATDSSQFNAPIWGATGYHINNEVGTADIMLCTSTPPPRLIVGQTATVIPGLGNNVLRGMPGTGAGSSELNQMPPNASMTVLGGPYCGSGFNWWLVNYQGQIGYTAEGDRDNAGIYWLQPN